MRFSFPWFWLILAFSLGCSSLPKPRPLSPSPLGRDAAEPPVTTAAKAEAVITAFEICLQKGLLFELPRWISPQLDLASLEYTRPSFSMEPLRDKADWEHVQKNHLPFLRVQGFVGEFVFEGLDEASLAFVKKRARDFIRNDLHTDPSQWRTEGDATVTEELFVSSIWSSSKDDFKTTIVSLQDHVFKSGIDWAVPTYRSLSPFELADFKLKAHNPPLLASVLGLTGTIEFRIKYTLYHDSAHQAFCIEQ